jgi:undecaprenyl-diphosphatase
MKMRKLVQWFSTNDQRAALYIFHNWRNRTLEKWLSQATHLGDAWFAVLSMFVVTIVTRFDIRGALALAASHCIVQLIKKCVPRLRPYDRNEQIALCGIPLKDYSFPSGHTNAAFTIATVMTMLIPALFVVFFSLAALVGFSRIYLGFHYPTDVAIGAIIGMSSTIAVFVI